MKIQRLALNGKALKYTVNLSAFRSVLPIVVVDYEKQPAKQVNLEACEEDGTVIEGRIFLHNPNLKDHCFVFGQPFGGRKDVDLKIEPSSCILSPNEIKAVTVRSMTAAREDDRITDDGLGELKFISGSEALRRAVLA
jgi:hypothetical protein